MAFSKANSDCLIPLDPRVHSSKMQIKFRELDSMQQELECNDMDC